MWIETCDGFTIANLDYIQEIGFDDVTCEDGTKIKYIVAYAAGEEKYGIDKVIIDKDESVESFQALLEQGERFKALKDMLGTISMRRILDVEVKANDPD